MALSNLLHGLYKALGLNLAGLDYEEQDKRRGLETNLVNAAKTRTNALRSSSIDMADRGMTQSGVALQQATKVNMAGDENVAQLNQGFQGDLSSIARKRVQAESDYNLKKLELEHQATSAQDPLTALPTTPLPTVTNTASIPSNPAAAAQRTITKAATTARATTPTPKKVSTSVSKQAPPRAIATPRVIPVKKASVGKVQSR